MLFPDVLDLLGRLLDGAVGGPVKVGAVIVMGVERLVCFLREKGLVRVKGLDVEEPVVLGVVGVDEFEALGKGLGLRLV